MAKTKQVTLDFGKLARGSQETIDLLKHLSAILHLFHHRSKNQHRRSIWWRHFSLLRRHSRSTLDDIKILRATPFTHLERAKKKPKDDKVVARNEQRLDLWRDVLVPKWQYAFSQIVADKQFAALGLVLMAVLAELCRIFGLTTAYEDLGQAEVERVLERFADEAWDGEGPATGNWNRAEDVGEVISRDAEMNGIQQVSETGGTSTQPLTTPPASDQRAQMIERTTDPSEGYPKTRTKTFPEHRIERKPTKAKKRKKGDAIDDLFSGLG